MAINPLSSTLGGYGNVQRPATDAARGNAVRPEQARGGENAAVTQRNVATGIAQPAQRTLPPTAPAGTDPELWSVLTAEERTFFAKVGSMGPLTYGRMTTSAPSAPPGIRGGRLDVKV
ncbi:MAG TPA: hypothetical protein VGE02_00870 [Gemmatimonadales bacterium]